MRFSSQKRSIARSMPGKSGTFGTGLYMFADISLSSSIAGALILVKFWRERRSFCGTRHRAFLRSGTNTLLKSAVRLLFGVDALSRDFYFGDTTEGEQQ